MQNPFSHCSETHRVEAIAELRAELTEFSHDGLIQLIEDLKRGAVVRGSWTGCVISYKRGAPGSARRDRLGRARNAFTVLWDNGWLTDEEVIAAAMEILRNEVCVPSPAQQVMHREETVESGAPARAPDCESIDRAPLGAACGRAA